MALYDEMTEQSVLGAALLGGGLPEVTLWLTERDFWTPKHQRILAAVQAMLRRAEPVDVITVTRELESAGQLSQCGGAVYLHHLARITPTVATAGWYAEQLRQITRVRMLHTLGQRLVTTTEAEVGVDALAELEEAARSRIEQDLADMPSVMGGTRRRLTLRDLLAMEATAPQWVSPGVIARDERAVIVAGEGVSKTTLLRQIGVCISAGLNPWNAQRTAPGQKVLFIDAENSENQSIRALKWITGRCYRRTMASGWQDRFVIECKNAGLDLAKRDNAWFRDVAGSEAPDLLILGPAYKLMAGGDPKDDGDVMALLSAIDQVRVQLNCAVLIEQHAPHGQGFQNRDMRPFGSSRWLAWPEVGIGYQRDLETPELYGQKQARRPEFLEAVDWRGMREERDWPTHIRYGGPKELPWVPTDPDWVPSIDPIDGNNDEAGEAA